MGDYIDELNNVMPAPGNGRPKRARIDKEGNFVAGKDVYGYNTAVRPAVRYNVSTNSGAANSVKAYGAVGDGVTDDTAAIISALTSGAKCVLFPPGTYLVNIVQVVNISNDLCIKLEGTVKGSAVPAFLESAVMDLRGVVGGEYSLAIIGPGGIDASNRNNVAAEGSGSGLLALYWKNVNVTDVKFSAGAGGDGKGDSGFVPQACQNVVVKGCHFSGWEDHGIYATGYTFGFSIPAKSFIATNNTFTGTGAGGIRLARDIEDCVISNNVFWDGNRAIQFGPGETGLEPVSFFNSCKSVVITNNVVSNMTNFGFDLRAGDANGKFVIANNMILDWGTAANSVAINMRGISNALVTGNVIRPFRQTLASATACDTGIYIQTETLLGVTYNAHNNVIRNNYIEILNRSGALNYGVYQANSTDTNWFGPNTMVNAPPRDYLINNGGDVTNTYAKLIRQTATGTGFGGIVPKGAIDANTNCVVSFPGSTDRYIEIFPSFTHEIFSYSPTTNGRNFTINATTNSVDAAPTGGSCILNLQSLGKGISIDSVTNKVTLNLDFATTYAGDAAAGAAGLTAGQLYKTATGALQIKL